jgi:uncharacterized protein YqhQ
MSETKLNAGCAIDGGVMFSSKEYYAIARYPKNSYADMACASLGVGKLKDENELEITFGKVDPPAGGVFNYIPFIAGIVTLFVGLFGKNDREPWKTVMGSSNSSIFMRVSGILLCVIESLALAGFSYLVGSWLAGMFGIQEGTFWYGFLLSLMIPFVSLVVIIVATHSIKGDLLNFHGAEHKVGNALRENLELTKDNISAQSKFHTNCSTNLVVNSSIVYPFIIAFLYIWSNSFLVAFLIGFVAVSSVTIELLRISTWVGNNFLGYIFNCFGLLVQHITVRDPEDRHIVAALAAMNTLLELERGERSCEDRI